MKCLRTDLGFGVEFEATIAEMMRRNRSRQMNGEPSGK